MAISANTLFNFTKSYGRLIEIIDKKGFKPRLVKEDMSELIESNSSPSFPMVCFCDIPLSQICNHMAFYGSYGIGLSKDWGIEKQLNPLVYIPSNKSLLYEPFGLAYHKAADKEKSNEVCKNLKYMFRFFKPLKGKARKIGCETDECVNFYDEREWRYLPSNDENFFFDESEYSNDDREKMNDDKKTIENEMEKHILEFGWEDVKYIFVETREDINEIKNHLAKNFKDDYSAMFGRITILSLEDVKNDF